MIHFGLTKIAKKWAYLFDINIRKCFFSKEQSIRDIPIIINNFNRLTTLVQLIDSLENRGCSNIYILDNASTYPPLLDYYKECKHSIIRLNENMGHLSLWKSGVYKIFQNSFYAYTDSDVVIDEQCPDDFMEVFLRILRADIRIVKVGFSLRIDDLPDYYKNKKKVIQWENQFWTYKYKTNSYIAPIDTTFALYRPFFNGRNDVQFMNVRTGFPYVARHLPWYNDESNLSDEEQYYLQHCKTITHWSGH